MATFEEKQQAWQLIDNAVSRLQGTRELHIGLQTALELLKPETPKPEAPKPEAPKPETPKPKKEEGPK